MALRRLARFLYAACACLGAAVVVAAALCFTPAPWRLYKWFSTDAYRLPHEPEFIVILGGGGVPSESGLVRAYHGAAMANRFPGAQVILSLPADGDPAVSAVGKMRGELILRGVEAPRIVLEDAGRNTREQAQRIRKMISPPDPAVLLVTSPDHMRRSLMTFRAIGFARVAASAAFPQSVMSDVTYDRHDLGGRAGPLPAIGENLTLRYRFWSNINYLSTIFRETFALAYYRIVGWI